MEKLVDLFSQAGAAVGNGEMTERLSKQEFTQRILAGLPELGDIIVKDERTFDAIHSEEIKAAIYIIRYGDDDSTRRAFGSLVSQLIGNHSLCLIAAIVQIAFPGDHAEDKGR